MSHNIQSLIFSETASNETLRKQFNENFQTVAPIAFLYERDTDKSKSISNSLKKIYLNDKPIDENKLSGLVHLYADALSGFAVHRAAELLAQKSNESVYYYRFNYNGRYSHFYMPNSDSQVPFGEYFLFVFKSFDFMLKTFQGLFTMMI